MLLFIGNSLLICLQNEYNDNGTCRTGCVSTGGQYYVEDGENVCGECTAENSHGTAYRIEGLMRRCTKCDAPGERARGFVCSNQPCYIPFSSSVQEYPFTIGNMCSASCTGYIEDATTLECSSGCASGFFMRSALNETVLVNGFQKTSRTIPLNYCVPECPESRPYALKGTTPTECVASCGALFRSGTECVTVCDSGAFERHVSGELVCVGECAGYYIAMSEDSARECVSQCPLYAQTGSLLCTSVCASKLFWGSGPRVCIEDCPDGVPFRVPFSSDAEELYTCSIQCYVPYELQLKKDGHTECVSTCPNGYRKQAGECVESCSPGYAERGEECSPDCVYSLQDGRRVCASTAESTQDNTYRQLDLEGKLRLVQHCPAGEFSSFAADEKRCGFCSAYYTEQQGQEQPVKECTWLCPGPRNGLQCITDVPPELFLDTHDIAVLRCPAGSFTDPEECRCISQCAGSFTVAADGAVTCIETCSQTQYRDQSMGRCGQSCGTGLFKDPQTMSCVTRCAGDTYYTDGIQPTCASSCRYFEVGLNKTECHRESCAESRTNALEVALLNGSTQCVAACPVALPLLDGRRCVSVCPSRYFQRDLSGAPRCVVQCWGAFRASVLGALAHMECVAGCASGEFQAPDGECVSACPAQASFSEGSDCVSQCTSLYFVSANGQKRCVPGCNSTFPRQKQTGLQIECAPGCQNAEFQSRVDASCLVSCGSLRRLGPYCVEECPLEAPFLQYSAELKHWECLYDCSEQFVFLGAARVCTACSPQQPLRRIHHVQKAIALECVGQCLSSEFAMTVLGVSYCVTQCPAGTYQQSGACVPLCGPGKTPLGGKCNETLTQHNEWVVVVFVVAVLFTAVGVLWPLSIFLRRKQMAQNARLRLIREAQIKAQATQVF